MDELLTLDTSLLAQVKRAIRYLVRENLDTAQISRCKHAAGRGLWVRTPRRGVFVLMLNNSELGNINLSLLRNRKNN
jgi:hypothetical protein